MRSLAALVVAADDGTPVVAPEWVHVVPLGEFRGHWSGQLVLLRDVELRQILVNFERDANPVVLDYEHQSEHAAHNGQPNPAAGWLTTLELRGDGLWARVEWTDRGRALVEAREYRYLSPTLALNALDRESGASIGVALLSAALTNTPFFLGRLTALFSAEVKMELSALIALLGLAATATLAECEAEIKRLKAAEAEAAAVKATAVPLADHLNALSAAVLRTPTESPEQLLERAVTCGALSPAEVDTFVRAALAGPQARQTRQWIEGRIAAGHRSTPVGAAQRGSAAPRPPVSAEQEHVNRLLGVKA